MANLFVKLVRAARALSREENGFAVPTVIMIGITILAVAGTTTLISIKAQGGVVRDSGTKSALAVAESGVSQATLYFNRGASPCAGSPGVWCGPVTGSAVNGGTVSYWVRSNVAGGAGCGDFLPLEVVSTGTFNGVTRRVYVTACSASGQAVFLTSQVKSKETITLESDALIRAGTATDGDMILSSNAKQCGQASVGVGRQLQLIGNAQYYSDFLCTQLYSTVLQQSLVLPPVNQGDAPTNNDNSRLFSGDLVSGNKSNTCFNGVKANGSAGSCGPRHLDVGANTSVTLGGSTYSFCRLTLSSNSAVYVAPGASVKIFFDTPEACGLAAGTKQLDLSSNSRITPAAGLPSSLALLFVGSAATATAIQLSSNTTINGPCDLNFVVYAPLSDIDLNSNSKFCGAVAGKSLHLDSNAEISVGTGSTLFTLPNTPPHYVVSRFVECSATGAPAGNPASEC